MNLLRIQKKIDEFIDSNSKDMLTVSEYYIYTANLLMAIAIPAVAADVNLINVEPKIIILLNLHL